MAKSFLKGHLNPAKRYLESFSGRSHERSAPGRDKNQVHVYHFKALHKTPYNYLAHLFSYSTAGVVINGFAMTFFST